MKPLDLAQLAPRLGRLSQLLFRDCATAAEADQFYALLDKVLALPLAQERRVVLQALGDLTATGDTSAAQWLGEELDVEAQMQHVRAPDGRERACVLFAIPVVLPGDAVVTPHAVSEDLMQDVLNLLQEHDVIDAAAQVGLVPRLLSYSELVSKTHGQLKRLTLFLAAKVLSDEHFPQLPEDFELEPETLGASCSAWADLHFLTGIACAHPDELDVVFPALPNDDTAGPGVQRRPTESSEWVDFDEKPPLSDSGELADSPEPWEQLFAEAFEDAFGVMPQVLTTLPPDGLPEDLRRGLSLSREMGLTRFCELQAAGVALSAGPLQSIDDEWFVDIVAQGVAGALGRYRWVVLSHETESESLEQLMQCLEACGYPQRALADASNPLGSLTLH